MNKSSEDKAIKTSSNRQKKEQIVSKLAEKAEKANAFVFADYKGMTHKQIEELKKALKKVDAEMVVAKNSLVALALQKVSKVPSSTAPRGTHDTRGTLDTLGLKGPTITLFSFSDIVSPLKELTKTIKTLNLPKIKFGIFEGKVITDVEIIKLSTLPSKEVLLAQVVAGLKSPIFGLHRALSWNIQKLVLTLRAVETKKV